MDENPNNNADFDAEVRKLIPAEPDMTVQEFVDKAKNLLDEMLTDHHERTGVESQDWTSWVDDLTAAYINS